MPVPTRLLSVLVVACLSLLALAGAASAQIGGTEGREPERSIEILPIEGLLDPPVAAAITDVIEQAGARGSELVVIQIDSRGGVSADVERLVRTLESSTVPVAVLVGPQGTTPRAAGAATLLLAAADIRAASPDASIGPLLPVDLGGDPPGDDAVAVMASLWPQLDEVDAVAAGQVGATDLGEGSLDLLAGGLEPLLVELDGVTVDTAAGPRTLEIRRDEFQVRFHSLGLIRRMLHAATTPEFIYLLFGIGLALLLFEVFQPGFGVAGIAGVVMAAIGVFGLTVLPVHLWAVALVVLGLVLYSVDVAVAGFGPLTALATASFGAGSWWLYDSPVLGLPAWLVVLTTLAAVVFFVIVVTVVLRAQAGPDDVAVEDLVGRVGMVRSVLNPEGHVYVDDALWRARWTGAGSRARVGTPIRVVGVEGALVLVDRFDPDAPAEDRAAASSDV